MKIFMLVLLFAANSALASVCNIKLGYLPDREESGTNLRKYITSYVQKNTKCNVVTENETHILDIEYAVACGYDDSDGSLVAAYAELTNFATGEKINHPDMAERIRVIKKHLLRSIEWKGEKTGIFEMRPHYTNYFRGIQGIKPYRQRLVTADGVQATLDILDEIADNIDMIIESNAY